MAPSLLVSGLKNAGLVIEASRGSAGGGTGWEDEKMSEHFDTMQTDEFYQDSWNSMRISNSTTIAIQIAIAAIALASILALTSCAPAAREIQSVSPGRLSLSSPNDASLASVLERPQNAAVEKPRNTIDDKVGAVFAPYSDAAPTGAAQPNPIEASWNKKLEAESWTESTLSALDQEGERMLTLAPADASDFCPNYASLSREDRKAVWVQLISAMAVKESDLDPTQTYVENFKDSSKNRVKSRGLLQLSFESAQAYGCEVSKPEDLHNSALNLRCGVKILDHWISQDGVIASKAKDSWRGGARYWSVLRNPQKRKFIFDSTGALALCHPTTVGI